MELQQYFGTKSWYDGRIAPDAFDSSVFNDYESKNIDLLAGVEFSLSPNGYQLDQPGYDIFQVKGALIYEDISHRDEEWVAVG